MVASAGTIEEPERGTWVADVESRDDFDGELHFGGVSWVGRQVAATRENGRVKARIVGGAGDLGTEVPDKWYLGGGTGNTIVSDIARLVGIDASPSLPQRVASWQRAKATAGEALDQICDALGAQWWVDRAGVLQAGAREASTVDAPVESTDASGIATIAAESSAAVSPGQTLPDGAVIRHVRHMLRGDTLRIEASTVALRVREPAGLGYLRMHRGVVERQHDDGSLDLIVDNTHSLTRVPWLPGVPAVCVLKAGDVVQVASWAGGNPRQWAAVGVSRVEGGTAVAGIDDTVDCGVLLVWIGPPIPPGTATTTAVTYVPPAPADTFAARLATALLTPPESKPPIPPPPPGPGLPPTRIPLTGLITSGNPRILAGGGGKG